jgi:myo-inositol-1-phosphate synthase
MPSFLGARVGGWDVVRPSDLQAHLVSHGSLPYELASQVPHAALAAAPFYPGAFSPRFYGESVAGAAAAALPARPPGAALAAVRENIRSFKASQRVAEVTVLYSGSVENYDPAHVPKTVKELMGIFAVGSERDPPPSLVYATAALLEGCSYVRGERGRGKNAAMAHSGRRDGICGGSGAAGWGGSRSRAQRRTCSSCGGKRAASRRGRSRVLGCAPHPPPRPGRALPPSNLPFACRRYVNSSSHPLPPALVALADANGVYVLGTDFKAGQTKFKSCAVEYLRAVGMDVRCVASSNHLGNGDMRNLASGGGLGATLRVKGDVFKCWDMPNLEHTVAVSLTPFIGDEKRDFVE